jgi:hypothetical protein
VAANKKSDGTQSVQGIPVPAIFVRPFIGSLRAQIHERPVIRLRLTAALLALGPPQGFGVVV